MKKTKTLKKTAQKNSKHHRSPVVFKDMLHTNLSISGGILKEISQHVIHGLSSKSSCTHKALGYLHWMTKNLEGLVSLLHCTGTAEHSFEWGANLGGPEEYPLPLKIFKLRISEM